MALLYMKIHVSQISELFLLVWFSFVQGFIDFKLGWVELVIVIGFGWFLCLFHLVFDTDSISDTFKTWTRPLVVRESYFSRFKGHFDRKKGVLGEG